MKQYYPLPPPEKYQEVSEICLLCGENPCRKQYFCEKCIKLRNETFEQRLQIIVKICKSKQAMHNKNYDQEKI